ncbi:NACHT domain-containing protein [Streptomyces sp. NPDC002088]|uniref:NACHT domain-containing protein n=1 Tax=Streptomyces sp. NPDC002088 TaxID=3154665 RepID=UPI00332399FD
MAGGVAAAAAAGPGSAQVRWASAEARLADHRENVGGPEDLSARLKEVAEVFARVPSRRLVVLGEPGSGKTVLALRFTLDLLERRRPEDPVPVVFSLSNWQPDQASLREWMAASLAATYPGATWGRELLAAGRVLLVLDGLDEIPAPLQAHAVRRLNAELDAGAPVLLTCRTGVYTDVVERGDVFTLAAVVELQPLTFEDIRNYLQRTARAARGPDGQRATCWDPILDHLRSRPDEPASRALCQVLTSPLMAAMARTVYDDTGADPAELLAPRFHDPAVLEQHLLDAFVPAAFRDAPTPDGDDARRWLGFLARHMERRRTRDLAWWDLTLALPWPLRSLRPVLLLGGVATAVSLVWGQWKRHSDFAVPMAMAAFTAGVCMGYAVLSRGPAWTARRQSAVPGRRHAPREAVLALTIAVPVGVIVGLSSPLGNEFGPNEFDTQVDVTVWAFLVGFAVFAGLGAAVALAVLGIVGESLPSTVPFGGGASRSEVDGLSRSDGAVPRLSSRVRRALVVGRSR